MHNTLLGKEDFSRLLRQEKEFHHFEQEIQVRLFALKALKVLEDGVNNGDLGASVAFLEITGRFEPGAYACFTRERKEREVKQ